MWLPGLLESLAEPWESYLSFLRTWVNSDSGSISFAVLLIIVLVFWKLSKRRLKGLLDLLGSTYGNGNGTLEGNSLASNIGYLLNKYTLTWGNHGVILSRVLDRLRHVEALLELLSEKNEDAQEEDATAPVKHLNASLLDDHEEEDAGDDYE